MLRVHAPQIRSEQAVRPSRLPYLPIDASYYDHQGIVTSFACSTMEHDGTHGKVQGARETDRHTTLRVLSIVINWIFGRSHIKSKSIGQKLKCTAHVNSSGPWTSRYTTTSKPRQGMQEEFITRRAWAEATGTESTTDRNLLSIAGHQQRKDSAGMRSI